MTNRERVFLDKLWRDMRRDVDDGLLSREDADWIYDYVHDYIQRETH